eukprot:7702126-Pyramimonas_sp.AAC.1
MARTGTPDIRMRRLRVLAMPNSTCCPKPAAGAAGRATCCLKWATSAAMSTASPVQNGHALLPVFVVVLLLLLFLLPP